MYMVANDGGHKKGLSLNTKHREKPVKAMIRDKNCTRMKKEELQVQKKSPKTVHNTGNEIKGAMMTTFIFFKGHDVN